MNESYYRTYDKKGKFIRNVPSHAIKTDLATTEFLRGVSCFVIQGDKLIFEVRADNVDAGGRFDFCSGKVAENESPEQAIIRELCEEYGISKDLAENVVELNTYPIIFDSYPANMRNFIITFYYLYIHENIKFAKQESEVEKFVGMQINKSLNFIRKSGKTKFPYTANTEKTLTKLVCHLYMDGILTTEQANSLILPLEARPREKQNFGSSTDPV